MKPKYLLLISLAICFSWSQLFGETLSVSFMHKGKPPMTFSENSPTPGIFKEILDSIAEITGDKIVYEYYPPKRIMARFEQGKNDLEMGINPNWRSSSSVPGVYTIPFSKSINLLVFRPGKKIPVQSANDLKGKRLGTIGGYYYVGYMDAFANGDIIRETGTNEENLMLRMTKGRFDQAIMAKEIAYYLIKSEPQFRELEIGDITSSLDIMIRVHPSKSHILERFNKAILQLQQSGKIEAIYKKYR